MQTQGLNFREEIRNGQVRHSRDDLASEFEMGDLLYGLVKMIKPALVVETGCYVGDTAAGILRALKENGSGYYIGCDTQSEYVLTAQEFNIGTAEQGEFRCCRSDELEELEEADLLFSDSGGNEHEGFELRKAEYKAAKPGCYYVTHDTQWVAFAQWLRSVGGLVFPAGRGFGLAIKP